MEKEEEERLAKRAQAGDREALGLLWDAITPKLFGYLVNTTKNKALAEDLLQTTWLKALDKLHTFTPRGHGLQAWLFAIAKNECRMHWRKSAKELPLDTLPESTDGEADKKMRIKILIDEVMARLPEKDQELIRLRYIADLPVKDIAKILNINFIAIRVRIHRALNRARTLIQENYEK